MKDSNERSDSVTQEGTVILLGAGASAEAGYPTAEKLLEYFKSLLREVSETERLSTNRMIEQIAQRIGKSGGDGKLLPQPLNKTKHEEWFDQLWQIYKKANASAKPLAIPKLSNDGSVKMKSSVFTGPTGFPSFANYTLPIEGSIPLKISEPYLEDFFAFYDDLLRPRMQSILPSFLPKESEHWLRILRKVAIKAAYRSLSPSKYDIASYLKPLFNLNGPTSRTAPIATLNFDMSIEQLALDCGISLFDGFAKENIEHPSPNWNHPNLSKLWKTVSNNLIPFVGFENSPPKSTLLLKLHRSLGWFVLEEGTGDIGNREDMRHNSPYQFFRLPYPMLLELKGPNGLLDIDILVGGEKGDPITHSTEWDNLTRNAGYVSIRPYMIYAVALKAHLDRLSLDLLGTFGRFLSKAKHLLVIGYSWSDPHINDLLLGAVAQGCTLVNVGRNSKDERFLALWRQRFPTTYQLIAKRLYGLGGGAKEVLINKKVLLPSGEINKFDIVSSLNSTLPQKLSLAYQLVNN